MIMIFYEINFVYWIVINGWYGENGDGLNCWDKLCCYVEVLWIVGDCFSWLFYFGW